jgi:SPP1 family phage portal protein
MGNHEIFNRTKENDGLKNNKVMINHAKYITDMAVGYLLGNPVDYQASDGYDIEPIIDAYARQTINDLDSEIAKDVSIYGIQREYVYANEEAEPKSCEIDNENSIIVYDDTVEHNKMFGLIYRPIYEGNTFKYYDIIYCDDKSIIEYQSTDKVLSKIGEEKPHMFGKVPMIEYKNNPELIGDFEPVISLIDAYNMLQSDRVNDKEQLVDAILCMYGMDFTDEQAELLKESRMLASIPADGKVEYLIKQLQEGDVDVLRKNLERDIHKISMVPNMSDENFVGNASGVAIKYKLLAFEQMTKNKERYMEKGLKERFELYNNFLVANSKMQEVPLEEVDAVFKRNLPQNDFEISQMINNLVDIVDTETLLAQLSFIKDPSDIIEAKETEDEDKKESDLYANAFKENEIPDANNPVQAEQPVENNPLEENKKEETQE